MQLRRLTVIALALGGLSLPARAQDVIRLFAPVPAGKIVLPPPPAAQVPPRTLGVRRAPAIRGSLRDGEPPDPPAAEWQPAPPAPSPRVIRNAAR